MDPTYHPRLTNQTPPSPPPSSSFTNFPILAISILGIVTTAIILLSYYIFVTKCCLNWRLPPLIRILSTIPSPHRRHPEPPVAHSRGLDPSAIRAIPIIRFTIGEPKSKSSTQECPVCLNEFHDDESLRLLPTCSHVFHIDCIDIWLQSHANCPLCRSDITTTILIPCPPNQAHSGSVVIEVGGDPLMGETISSLPNKKAKKRHQVSSMGDECIDARGRDERFLVQPMRRSFSMDSCCDRQLYVAVQEILQRNPELLGGAGSGEGSSSGASGKIRRSFFSFGYSRSSRNAAVLPVEIDL